MSVWRRPRAAADLAWLGLAALAFAYLFVRVGSLLVDPVASEETFTTDPILLGEVQQIEWTVAAHLPNSRLLLR